MLSLIFMTLPEKESVLCNIMNDDSYGRIYAFVLILNHDIALHL